jgi:adenylate cyclase
MSDLTDVTRRLVAVFAADVEGYSRLMGIDEVATLKGLTARRAILDRLIGEHRGRIANTAGDSVLAEFRSAVDAVQCAVEAQTALAEVNSNVHPDRRINFRIGVHIGDVMVRGGDLFGDGVNIAARLQTLAQPGSVCVSGATYEQVKKILPIPFADLGAQQVKNIEEPVRVFSVGPRKRSPKVLEAPRTVILDPTKPPLLPSKPSIAVLPFQNMSGDPDQEYFADGMVEDIITALSRFKSLFVIARNSSFVYKGKAVDIKQVGRELGVRYVLEGSVRKGGGRVRITGQLIEAATGRHLWADRFEGSLENVFDLQDSVATSVVGAIVPQLMLASAEQVARRPADSLDSYDRYLRGIAFGHKRTLEGNRQAQAEFDAAISLDPTFALAYAQSAFCLHNRYYNYLHAISDEERRSAVGFASRAVELAPSDDGMSFGLAAFVIGNLDNDLEGGLALANRAIAINPNYANAYTIKAYLSALLGNTPDVRPAAEYAVRLNPLDVGVVIAAIRTHMCSCVALRQHEEAAAWARKLLSLSPNDVHGLLGLNAEAFRRGDMVEAERLRLRVQTLYPHLRKEHMRQMYLRYRNPEHQAAMAERISWSVDFPE